jgi:hypothetical protein
VSPVILTPPKLRIPAGDWEAFRLLHGRGAPEAVRQFIAWSLHLPGARLPGRAPGPPAAPEVPDEVVAEFRAWYLRLPGAQLPRRPRGETKAVPIRIPAGDWEAFRLLHGRGAPEAVRQFIAWSLHRPGARLPVRLGAPAHPG